ncbi:VanZ family protein [Streptococcus uberis]|uniref:VanZ family protein n=1 Tax=Streptococcus uberis TaxID=1349 RepID=UPI003796F2E2
MLKSKKLTIILFYLYLFLLSWCILFKFETQLEFIKFFQQERVINWLPFTQPVIVNGDIVFAEMGFNLLFFIPFGVCLPIITPNWTYKKIVALGLLLSLFYETLQFILAIGMSDITDLLFNTLGVCCGILLYQLINKLFKNNITALINIVGILFVAIPTIGLLTLVILGLK